MGRARSTNGRLTEIRDRVNSEFAPVWNAIQNRQEQYYAANGEYWQGLMTHRNVPEHTIDTDGDGIPDALDRKPSDGKQTWRQFLPEINVSIPYAIKVDTYSAPEGDGYVATVRLRYGGDTYERSMSHGPVDHSAPWQKVEPDEEA